MAGDAAVRRLGGMRGSAAFVAWTALLAWCGPGHAAEAETSERWLVRPSVDLGAFYDDNVGLVTSGEEAESGYVLVPHLRVNANTERTKTAFDGYVAHTSYVDATIDDRTEVSAFLTSEHLTSERGALGLNGEYRYDTLYQRVSVGPGTGNIRDVDIGLSTSTDVRRSYWMLEPSWQWLLTELSSVRVAYRHTDADFRNAEGTDLIDYQDDFASLGYTRSISPRTDVNVTLSAGLYQPDIDEESRTLQLLGGFARKFSDTARGQLSAGVSRTRTEANGEEDTSSGFVFYASAEQRSDISTLDGVISHDITPSGLGRTLQSDQVRIRWALRTAHNLEWVLQGQFLRTEAIEGDDPSADRSYYEIEPQVRWQWLENWFVTGSYRYRRQRYEVDDDAATSNAVLLGITWAI